MQEASWQLWLTGQSTEGTDMNIQRSRKEQWLGTEGHQEHMENLGQGDLDIRLLGTQPSQEGGSPRLIHWLQERSFDPTQPLYTSHGSLWTLAKGNHVSPSDRWRLQEQSRLPWTITAKWTDQMITTSTLYLGQSYTSNWAARELTFLMSRSLSPELQWQMSNKGRIVTRGGERHSWEVGHVDCIYHCISHNARVSQICPVVPRCWRIRGLFHPLLINDFFPLHQCVQLAPTLERYYPNTTGMTCNLVVSLIQHAR